MRHGLKVSERVIASSILRQIKVTLTNSWNLCDHHVNISGTSALGGRVVCRRWISPAATISGLFAKTLANHSSRQVTHCSGACLKHQRMHWDSEDCSVNLLHILMRCLHAMGQWCAFNLAGKTVLHPLYERVLNQALVVVHANTLTLFPCYFKVQRGLQGALHFHKAPSHKRIKRLWQSCNPVGECQRFDRSVTADFKDCLLEHFCSR